MLLLPIAGAVAHPQDRAAQAPPRELPARSWVYESWTVKDGLPVNSINSIIQDRTGYIWASTFDGLVRFDGVRFTVFNSANSEALPSNRIVQLKEGRDGELWMASEQGHILRFRAGRFTHFAYPAGKSSEGLVSLFVDSAGAAWVGAPNGLWTVRRDTLVQVGAGILDGRVSAIVQRRDGRLWVGTDHAGLYRVDRDGRVAHVATAPALESDFITRMFEDASGTLWIAGVRALWSWRDRLVQVRGPRLPFHVEFITQLPSTGAVFAVAPAGIFRVEGDTAVPVPLSSRSLGHRMWTDATALWTVDSTDVFRDGRRVFTLPARRQVSASLFDREGSLWLGTDAGGLYRLKPALITTYSAAEGVGNPNVYATYIDRSGTVWFGTWGAGAGRIDPATGRVTMLGSDADLAWVNSFHQDQAGRMWIAAGEGPVGLYVCTPPAMTCVPESSPAFRERPVFALFGDTDGRLWAGAAGLLLRQDRGSWTALPASTGAPAATVRAFAATRDGALWMGTNGGGLARYREGTFTRVSRADGLPSDLVRSLYADADGWLWVGTEGRGLVRLDPRAWRDGRTRGKESIVRIGARDGLFDEVIHQILEDDAGRLWMNTNRGIFWVTRSELNAFADGKTTRIHSTAYNERDGMRNREGNGGVQPAGAKGLDGRLWFPTQDGVVVVDPARVRREHLATPLVVERAVAGGSARAIARDSIVLNPNERDVQLEYTALTFLEPSNVRFRYRLEPYDADWVDAGNRRTAFYTKVPPGRYTFRVEASDAAGGWNEPGIRMAVRVLPQFWETGLFRWALTAALGLLLLVAVRLREARLRARALQLERVVDDRTVALRDSQRELAERNAQLQSLDQARTRFFANVSHELRTPLTLTIGPLEDLRARANGDAQAQRWLDLALRNARRLLRLVNQILDVAKLEAHAMHLVRRPLDLGAFTRGVVAAFVPAAERKGIRLTVDAPALLRGAFDADALEKILTNLLSNAIKFTPGGGAVHVALSHDHTSAKFVVRDSGPGIPPDRVIHVFERFYQVDESATRTQPGTGIGLSLVKELVELHGGTIDVVSGSDGTAFTATIPSDGPLSQSVGGASTIASATEVAAVEPLALTVAAEPSSEAGDAPDGVETASQREDVPLLLVVDDSADLRRYIRDHFAPHFRVLEASDGEEGIALARRHLPDVVLSDVMMPRVDGHELVRTLRASPETDFLAIVLLTAQADDAQRLAGLERGADEYLVKPFEMRELDVRVRNLMLARRRWRERFSGEAAAPPARSESQSSGGQPIATAMSGTTTAVAPADQDYVARVRDAIRQRLADPGFGVGELADAVSQDRSHLFRRIKQLLGESPSDVIRRMRLEEGARLLEGGTATVTDVAYAVGFNSLSYFCRCFQDVYGVTPAAYRGRATPSRD